MIKDDASLFQKLIELQKEPSKPVVWNWTANFIINDKNFPVLNVNNINKTLDFEKNQTEVVFMEVQISITDYTRILLPNKDKLLMKVTKELGSSSATPSQVMPSYSQTFVAFLTDAGSPFVASNESGIDNSATDDLSNVITTHIQLVDRNFYEFRLYEMAGIYRSINVSSLLVGLMSQPLKSNGGKSVNVNMIKAENEKEYFQMLIPQGIRLSDMPDYIQRKYGVYATGLGCYLFMDHWFIYPLLNHQVFNDTTKTLTVISVPPREMMANDKSYLTYDDSIVMFSSGDTFHLDKSENILNNIGRGLKYSIAGNIVDTFFEVDNEGPHIPVGRNYVSVNSEPSPTKLENIVAIPGLLTDNPWYYFSNFSIGLASIVILRWDFANVELLYPGMPTKILYKHKGIVQSMKGTLLKVECTTATDRLSPTDKRYITTAQLYIHCERVMKEPTSGENIQE